MSVFFFASRRPMAALTENEIIDIVYSLYETDDTGWDTASSEYLSARIICNAAIKKWEMFDNTVWRELWTTLDDAADGDKTITAGTYDYDCPTNFAKPSSWVRLTDSNDSTTIYKVVSPEELSRYTDSKDSFCYFTGNPKDGYDLHFNPNLTLTTGDTIHYEYYKVATLFTASNSTTEVPDPYYLVYYTLARLLKNDGEDYSEEANQWRELLENMRVTNMAGYFDIPNPITHSIISDYGFGN